MTFNLDELLNEQVQFLKSSCAAFDSGFDGEAKRMAVSVRVLLHDTASSHSLFKQMGRKKALFYNPAGLWSAENLVAHHSLLNLRFDSSGANYVPILDNIFMPIKRWSSFDDWWNEIIFDDRKNSQLKRRDIVLGLANKEGGAHVDPKLNTAYETITRRSQFWFSISDEGQKSFDGKMERIAMRQIAHEVLRTIDQMSCNKPEQP